MNLYKGKLLKYLRVDIQDSSNSWVVTGDIRTENYVIGTATVAGDVNADGTFSLTDLVLFQKWLAGEPVTLSDAQAGDLVEDGVRNVLDVCRMKQMLHTT
jgi:hypothetical protein